MSVEQGMIQIEVPEYAFEIIPNEDGEPYVVAMKITGSAMEFQSFLCLPNAQAVELVARAFNREFLRVSTTLKRQGKHIIPASGVNSDALRSEKRRK